MSAGQPINSQVTATPAKRGRFAFWRSLDAGRVAMWVVTGAWILYLAAAINAPGVSVASLELNELGDFLAGGFAPLAFAWLVYGYFMQASELRLQRDELQLQREEMASTRAELARTASATEAAHEAATAERKRQLEPRFAATVTQSDRTYFRITLECTGGIARDVYAFAAQPVWKIEGGSQFGTIVPGQTRQFVIFASETPAHATTNLYVEFGKIDSEARLRAEWSIDNTRGAVQTKPPYEITDTDVPPYRQ